MRAILIAIVAGTLAAIGCSRLYAHRATDVVIFSHGTPEVPQGRMFTIFNPFRDRTSEHTAERLIADLRSSRCADVVRSIEGSENDDPRVCEVMSHTEEYALVWRRDGESSRVLVYAVPQERARLWISFRREEPGFVVSSVTAIR